MTLSPMNKPMKPESNSVDYIDDEDFIALEIPMESAGERLDKVLAHLLGDYSRNRLQSWLEAGAVTLNGKTVKMRQIVRGGEAVKVFPQELPEQQAFEPEDIPLNCQYDDADLLVFNKPANRVMHPAAGNWSGTVLNGLLFHYPELAHLPRAGIVHRLDKDTSGLFVVARSALAQTALVRQLQARSVERRYLAWVWGNPPLHGTIDSAIGRDPHDRLRMAVLGNAQSGLGGKAKLAVTHFKKIAQGQWNGAKVSLLECKLETGRTHQIRVHLESMGHPLLGDLVYRKRIPEQAKQLLLQRQALHAFALSLDHPHLHQTMSWFASPPQELLDLNPLLGIEGDVLPKSAVPLGGTSR